MSDDEKKKKTFEEKILETFPEGFKADFKPKNYDILNDSLAEIVEKSNLRSIFRSFYVTKEDQQMFDKFLDGLIARENETFEKIREEIKDPKIREQVLKMMVEQVKYGRR